jgi:D-arabinose 1-dehydrogenase-like Zn-dependent alcohol dehydrogenase
VRISIVSCLWWSLTILCSFGLQFALAAGAEVIALTSSKEKIEKVKALGAQHVINYKEVTNWEEEVKKIVSFILLCLFFADADL